MASYLKSRLWPVLKPMPADTGTRIKDTYLHGFHAESPSWTLATHKASPRGTARFLRDGFSLMMTQFAARRLLTLSAEDPKSGFTKMLNDQLLGGKDYPLLAGIAGILITGVSGSLLTIATTALAMGKRVHRVLAREGDEVWLTEIVGKVQKGKETEVIHSAYYWIVDPYRKVGDKVGFAVVVHEDRYPLTIDYEPERTALPIPQNAGARPR